MAWPVGGVDQEERTMRGHSKGVISRHARCKALTPGVPPKKSEVPRPSACKGEVAKRQEARDIGSKRPSICPKRAWLR